MSLGHNPQIKFQPDLSTRQGLERLAAYHHLGTNGDSANEVMKLVASQFAKIPGKSFFPALAALSEFQANVAFPKSKKSTIPDQLGII